MGKNRNRLFNTLVEASESDDLAEAADEWIISGCFDNIYANGTCICGHENIRYEYTIENTVNGNVLGPIGSSCICEFTDSEMANEVDDWFAAIRLLRAFREHGLNAFRDLDSAYFSRRLLEFMYEQDAFEPNEYNDYESWRDLDFMLKMFNKRTELSWRQQRKVWCILKYSIEPWLEGFAADIQTRE